MITDEQIKDVTKVIVDTAKIIIDEYLVHGSSVPESTIYMALGCDMDRYEGLAKLLELSGLERKNHAWYPGARLLMDLKNKCDLVKRGE
jgi:hypothetical protein